MEGPVVITVSLEIIDVKRVTEQTSYLVHVSVDPSRIVELMTSSRKICTSHVQSARLDSRYSTDRATCSWSIDHYRKRGYGPRHWLPTAAHLQTVCNATSASRWTSTASTPAWPMFRSNAPLYPSVSLITPRSDVLRTARFSVLSTEVFGRISFILICSSSLSRRVSSCLSDQFSHFDSSTWFRAPRADLSAAADRVSVSSACVSCPDAVSARSFSRQSRRPVSVTIGQAFGSVKFGESSWRHPSRNCHPAYLRRLRPRQWPSQDIADGPRKHVQSSDCRHVLDQNTSRKVTSRPDNLRCFYGRTARATCSGFIHVVSVLQMKGSRVSWLRSESWFSSDCHLRKYHNFCVTEPDFSNDSCNIWKNVHKKNELCMNNCSSKKIQHVIKYKSNSDWDVRDLQIYAFLFLLSPVFSFPFSFFLIFLFDCLSLAQMLVSWHTSPRSPPQEHACSKTLTFHDDSMSIVLYHIFRTSFPCCIHHKWINHSPLASHNCSTIFSNRTNFYAKKTFFPHWDSTIRISSVFLMCFTFFVPCLHHAFRFRYWSLRFSCIMSYLELILFRQSFFVNLSSIQ